MRFSLFLAFRYFFSPSRQTIVNLINVVSLMVIVVATAALFIVLSAFSGLKTFGLSFSDAFDPDLHIAPKEGKTFVVDAPTWSKLIALDFVENAAPVLEDKVFLRFENKNHVAYLRGVSPAYQQVVDMDQLLGKGQWLNPTTNEVVLGNGIAQALSLGTYDYSHFLVLSAPKRKKSAGFNAHPFREEKAIVSGIYFASEELDKKYLFAPLSLAQKLLDRPENTYSGIVVKTSSNISPDKAAKQLAPLFKDPIMVRNRAQLNAALYKMLNTENLAIYLIFSLIIGIALFTVVGAISMMFLDKKAQLNILLAMGLVPRQVQQVFFLLGGMLSWVGGSIGIILAALLVSIQQHWPFLYIPGTRLPYPVEFQGKNLLLVTLTIFGLGILTSFWSTRGLEQKVAHQAKT